MVLRLITLLALLSITSNAGAQLYIGITGDFGNRVNYQPSTGVILFKRPISVSGGVTLLKHEEIRNGWFLQYGIAGGVLGYNIKAKSADTLNKSIDYPPDVFLEYTNLYASVYLTFGKQIGVNGKDIYLALGGGATRYLSLFSLVTGEVSEWHDNSFKTIFDFEMLGAENKIKGFAEVSAQTKLNRRILVGVQYRHHFKSALKGTYNFYHTKTPSSGTLSLTQRSLNILFLVKIGKKYP